MRLLHKNFQFVFEFKENEQNLLVVEQPTLFYEMIKELSADTQEESNFILSENNCPIKIKDNLVCSVNPLSLMLNERRMLNGLYEILQKEIMSSDLLLAFNKQMAGLANYMSDILRDSEFELMYSEQTTIQDLLKFLNVRFLENQETLIERIVDYIHAANSILKIQCFVFVNIFSYLTEYELGKLYEYACYQKVHILLLESRQPDDMSKFSNVVIIDKDFCEISWNG